jgi:hypothetical protein
MANVTSLFRSRKFWLAVVGVIQIIVCDHLGLDPAIWQAIAALIGVLIGAFAYEDAVLGAKLGIRQD